MSAIEEYHEPELVPSLDERRDRILEIVGNAAIDVGQELLEAKREHPGQFMDWVSRELPFGIDKAERIMAVTRAFATCDPIVQQALPRPWTTLFELTRLPIETVERSVDSGEVHPTMTREDARRLVSGETEPPPVERRTVTPGPRPGFDPIPRLSPDVVAGELLRLRRDDLDANLASLLHEWLGPPPQGDPDDEVPPGR